MLAQVESKINELNKQQIVEYYKKREEDLINWGLVTPKTKKQKSTALIVTDDEYEALVKAHTQVGKVGRNTVAEILNKASLAIVVLGVIFGIALYVASDSLSLVFGSISVVVSLAFALIFKGIAEGIKLIQQMSDRESIFRPSQEVILNVLAQAKAQAAAEAAKKAADEAAKKAAKEAAQKAKEEKAKDEKAAPVEEVKKEDKKEEAPAEPPVITSVTSTPEIPDQPAFPEQPVFK